MNRVKEILGIEYPVIQGAIARISNSKLVAAVSEAGGLGTLQTSWLNEGELEREIDKIQELTSKPFAVNFTLSSKKVERLLDIAIEKGVEIFCLSAGDPEPFLDRISEADVSMQVVPFARLAKRMEDYGFDLVIVEGKESGGEVSMRGTSTISLVPSAVEKVNIPVIAAGGIGDTKTAISVKKLGAEGIQMGTRFLASKECEISEKAKEFLVKTSESQVLTLSHNGSGMNAVENKYIRKFLEKSVSPKEFEKTMDDRIDKGMQAGDTENGIIQAGQSVGRIKEIEPVDDIVERIGKAFLSD